MEPGFNITLRRTRRNNTPSISDMLNTMIGMIEAPRNTNLQDSDRRVLRSSAVLKPETPVEIQPRCPRGTRKNKQTGKCDPLPPIIPEKEEIKDFDPEEPEMERNLFLKDPEVSQEDYDDTEPTALDNELEQTLKEPAIQMPQIKTTQPVILNDVLSTVPKESNQYIRIKEKIEYDQAKTGTTEYPFLYPDLNDPNFAVKLASRKEFNDFKYDGEIKSIEETADMLCKLQFENAYCIKKRIYL